MTRKQYYGEVVQGVLKPGNLQAKRRLKNVFLLLTYFQQTQIRVLLLQML